VAQELGHRAAIAHSASLKHVDAVAELGYEAHVLLGNDHGQALRLETTKLLREHVDHQWGQSLERLVEAADPPPSRQGARDREHLLLAARERARALVAPFKQAREELGNAFGRPRLRASVTPGAAGPLKVLVHREFPEDAPVLRHVADAEPGHLKRSQAA